MYIVRWENGKVFELVGTYNELDFEYYNKNKLKIELDESEVIKAVDVIDELLEHYDDFDDDSTRKVIDKYINKI